MINITADIKSKEACTYLPNCSLVPGVSGEQIIPAETKIR